jgi:hypothetical protein
MFGYSLVCVQCRNVALSESILPSDWLMYILTANQVLSRKFKVYTRSVSIVHRVWFVLHPFLVFVKHKFNSCCL